MHRRIRIRREDVVFDLTAMQRLAAREVQAARHRGPLHSLTPVQLRLHALPITVVTDGIQLWGHAWLRFGDTDVRCTVLVRRWTADAVGVELPVDDGDNLRCWIWQGACQRLARRTDAWA